MPGDAEEVGGGAFAAAVARLEHDGGLAGLGVPEPGVAVGGAAGGDDLVAVAQEVPDGVAVLAALVVPGDAQALEGFPAGEGARDRAVAEVDAEEDAAEVRGELELGEVARALAERERGAEVAAVEVDEARVGPGGVAGAAQEEVLAAEVVVDVAAVVHPADGVGGEAEERDVLGGVGVVAEEARHLGVEVGAALEEAGDEVALDEARAGPVLEVGDGVGRAGAVGTEVEREAVGAGGLAADAAVGERAQERRGLE